MQFDTFLREIAPLLDLEWRKYRRRAARRGVRDRMRELGLADYTDYLERVRQDPLEAAQLPDRMRITISRLFRERERWEVLSRVVLPELLRSAAPGDPLRAWSAGCCGGEEPYTLSLLWQSRFREQHPGRRLEVVASDIDSASLERARRGVYAPASLREVPDELRGRYFTRHDRVWEISNRVKQPVRFLEGDLMQTDFSSSLDLICCRYLVFTYYRGERRQRAADHLWRSLRSGGALMIGRKEDLGPAAELFEPWPGAVGIWRKPS